MSLRDHKSRQQRKIGKINGEVPVADRGRDEAEYNDKQGVEVRRGGGSAERSGDVLGIMHDGRRWV